MSTPDRDTVETVGKLLAERRKVSDWLLALAGRRQSTPAAVYQKVYDDYTGKLEKLQAKLVSASDSVQMAAANLEARLTEKEELVSRRHDERAEAELRFSVGEYGEREWEKRRAKYDEELASATAERDSLREELSRLRVVLDEVEGRGEPVVEPAIEPAVESASPAEMPEVAAAGSSFEAAEPEPEPDSQTSPQMKEFPPAVPPIPIHEQTIAAPRETARPSAPQETTRPSAPQGTARPSAPSFDELAFLKSVTSPPPHPVRESKPLAIPETPVPFPDPLPEPRVSGETAAPREGFFGRTGPRSGEAVKSLRCQECGTLNFPTEWYCERCGGELSAF